MVSKITDSEVLVMKVLWGAKDELTITNIRKLMEKTSDWESSTIKTLLSRLVKKGAVQVTKKEVFYYRALVTEEEYNEYTIQTLIDRLYNGSAKNLVASILGGNKLNGKDIEELRDMFKVGGSDE